MNYDDDYDWWFIMMGINDVDDWWLVTDVLPALPDKMQNIFITKTAILLDFIPACSTVVFFHNFASCVITQSIMSLSMFLLIFLSNKHFFASWNFSSFWPSNQVLAPLLNV